MKRNIIKYMVLTLAMGGSFMLNACGKDTIPNGNEMQIDLAYQVTQRDIGYGFQKVIDGFIVEENMYIAGTDEKGSSLIVIASLHGEAARELPLDITGSIAMIQPDSAGNILYISNEEGVSGNTILGKSDSNGVKLFEVNIGDQIKQSQSAYITFVVSDRSGNLYLSTESNTVLLYDENGRYQGMVNAASRISGMSAGNDGLVYLIECSEQKAAISSLDFKTQSLVNTKSVSESAGIPRSEPAEAGHQVLVNDGKSLYLYDINNNMRSKILDWVSCGINGDSVIKVFAVKEDTYFVFANDFMSEEGTKLLVVEKDETGTEKTILTYGTIYLDPLTQNKIIEFNQHSDEYFIDVINYDLESDPQGAQVKMITDILSGNCPDIIDVKASEVDKLIAAGILEDLYPYMEKDEEINKEDFLQNILEVYERDEKLYAVMPFFLVRTMVGKTRNVGEAMGWTLDDMGQLMERKPEAGLLEGATADSVLQMGINAEFSRFLDWETGECNFTGEEFLQLLEFANQFGMTAEASDYMQRADYLSADQYLLANAYIYNIKAYREQRYWFGEDVTFIGYPVETGVGNLVDTAVCSLAISSRSSNKEAAWIFIKSFLEPDYQSQDRGDFTFGFPIRREALELLIDQEMIADLYEDEEGNKIELPKSTWSKDGIEQGAAIYAASIEEMEEFQAFISSAESLCDYNTSVVNIITEEAAAYFAGQKGAEEVTDIIQSRVKIYIDENR